MASGFESSFVALLRFGRRVTPVARQPRGTRCLGRKRISGTSQCEVTGSMTEGQGHTGKRLAPTFEFRLVFHE
jgi:hypothetical protein